MARLTRAAAKKEAAQERQSESPNASKKLPVRAKDDGASEGEGDVAPAKQSTQPAKGNLTVFGDDDDNDDLANTVSAKAAPEVSRKPPTPQPAEPEEESEDDEAPEAVSTTQAASAIKKSTQAAQQAAQEQAAAQKRKRQQRDALFKQQAEERKKAEESSAAATGKGTAQNEKSRIPDVLPAEFLDDSSSEDEDGDDADGTAAAKSSLPKKRKVAAVERQLTRLDRGPRDQQVGTTVFSVAAKKQDGRLAPKAKYGAKARKEALLRRNRAAVQPRAGFFRQ